MIMIARMDNGMVSNLNLRGDDRGLMQAIMSAECFGAKIVEQHDSAEMGTDPINVIYTQWQTHLVQVVVNCNAQKAVFQWACWRKPDQSALDGATLEIKTRYGKRRSLRMADGTVVKGNVTIDPATVEKLPPVKP